MFLSLRTTTILTTGLLIASVSAACTNISSIRIFIEGPNTKNPQFARPIDFLTCPPANSSGCKFTRQVYVVPIPRYLNISTNPALNPDPSPSLSSFLFNLTATQETEIFDLVRYGYDDYNERRHPSNNTNTTASSDSDTRFIARERILDTRVSSVPGVTDVPSDSLLTVGSGRNGTLQFMPQMRTLSGMLVGCTGESEALEGVKIRVAAPYESVDETGGNITRVAGNLVVNSTRKDTKNVAGKEGGIGWLFVVGLVVVGGLVLE